MVKKQMLDSACDRNSLTLKVCHLHSKESRCSPLPYPFPLPGASSLFLLPESLRFRPSLKCT